MAIAPQFSAAYEFQNGLAAVATGFHGWVGDSYRDELKYGIIDITGAFVIPPVYDWLHHSGDRTFYATLDGKVGEREKFYIDYAGTQVTPALSEFEGVAKNLAGDWGPEGLAPYANEKGKWGWINKSGKWVIKPTFDRVGGFSEGLAWACVGTDEQCTRGYVDVRGDFVIRPQFQSAFPFFEGLACVSIGNGQESPSGWIDKTGAWVIPPRFASGGNFLGGLSTFSPVGPSRRYGFIDRRGEIVIQPTFAQTGKAFCDGVAPVAIEETPPEWRWGYIFR